MQQLQELVLKLNNSFAPDMLFINILTGMVVVVTILSMRAFKYTISSKFEWAGFFYYSACYVMLAAIGINRFIGYPPTYPLSSFLYLFGYLLFCGYMLYVGSTRYKLKGGDSCLLDKQYSKES